MRDQPNIATANLRERLATETRRGIENQEVFRLLVDAVTDYAIFVLDPTGLIATWSAGAARIKGYRADEIIGHHFSIFYPEEDIRAGKCEMELERATQDGRFEDEGWRLRKDGTRFWANVVITALRDAGGQLIGFAKVTRDLTERRRAEDERLAAEERFRHLVASVHDYAIFMLDPSGNIATWNVGAERIKGYQADEIIGRHFSVFYPAEDIAAGKCELELELAERVGRFEDEGWRLRKDGTRFWANVVIGPVRDGAGQLIGFSKVTRDLTERRAAERETAARLAAEQANRAKDEFLALLGHELRNPMAPIVTALQLMKLRSDGPSREQDVIERQVKHMIQLVDDLLDISRIARGKVELRRQYVDLRTVVAAAVEVASPLLEQRGHHLEVLTPPVALIVYGDEARLIQVFGNLMTNAAKYTDPGGHLRIELTLRGEEVVVEVTDDGVGIDPALLPRVFELFVQGAQGAERAGGGLGIGLALVKSLVGLHDGAVVAHSDGVGRGSRFTVHLPLAHPAHVPETAARAHVPLRATRRPRRVLVVDDNDDARDLLVEALVEIGHDVVSAADPIAALELVQTFDAEVAVLDIGLPVMDGYELAERIRERTTGRVPRMIALTGYGQDTDRARSQEAGFEVHLIKPVDVTRLLDTIAGVEPPLTRP